MLLVSKDPRYSKYHKNDYFKTNVSPNSNKPNLFSLFGVLLRTVSFNELKKSYQFIVSKCKHPSLITGSNVQTICLAILLFEFNFLFIEYRTFEKHSKHYTYFFFTMKKNSEKKKSYFDFR